MHVTMKEKKKTAQIVLEQERNTSWTGLKPDQPMRQVEECVSGDRMSARCARPSDRGRLESRQDIPSRGGKKDESRKSTDHAFAAGDRSDARSPHCARHVTSAHVTDLR